MSWMDDLRPASYRNVPFGVLSADGRFGRRNAIHEYPYRDTVWVEDLGRSARRITVTGFLVGADAIARREALIAAAEKGGDGQLVHPTLGTLNVSLIECDTQERWDKGRYFEIRLSVIEAGKRVFPNATAATGEAIAAAAAVADAAAASDFAASAADTLKQGAAVVSRAVDAAAAWARKAERLSNDATNLTNTISTLRGSYGRYFGGRRRGGFSQATAAISGTASTVKALISSGASARSRVSDASSSLTSIAAALGL